MERRTNYLRDDHARDQRLSLDLRLVLSSDSLVGLRIPVKRSHRQDVCIDRMYIRFTSLAPAIESLWHPQ